MTDKHILRSPTTLVVDSLRGLCSLNPRVGLDEANKGRLHLVSSCLASDYALHAEQSYFKPTRIGQRLLWSVVEVRDTSPLMRDLSVSQVHCVH